MLSTGTDQWTCKVWRLGVMSCWDIDQKVFLPISSIWSWPQNPWPQKSIEVIFWPKAMYLWSLNVKGPWVVKLLTGNCFYDFKVSMPLTAWPKSIVVNYLPSPMHLRSLGTNNLWFVKVIDRKTFLPTRSIWHWPLDPKIDRVISWSWTITIPSL
jgi:hypothetical protein